MRPGSVCPSLERPAGPESSDSASEEVLGLEVPVDDPLLVGGHEALPDLHRVIERLADVEASGLERLAQRLPFEKLRDGVGGLAFEAHVVKGEDVRVREGGHGLRLALEPLAGGRVRRHARGKNLQRDLAAQPRVLRPVDLPHPALAERREDLVRAEFRAGSETQRAPSRSGKPMRRTIAS